MPRKKEQLHGRVVRFRKHLGEWLAVVRRERGWSARELEARSGVSASEIQRLEGMDRECRLESMIQLANAFGWPPGLLVDEILHFASRTNEFLEIVEEDVEFAMLAERFGLIGNRRDLFAGVLSGWCNVADILCRCGNAAREYRRVTPFCEASREPFRRFAEKLDCDFTPDDRLNFIARLWRHPITELRQQGLMPDAALIQAVEHLTAPKADVPSTSPKQRGKSSVDNNQLSTDKPDVRHTWPDLKMRLAKATAVHGKKAEVAKFVGVDRSNLNRWLDDDQEPGAGATFLLLEWVEAEEAKIKSAEGVSASSAPPTRTAKKQANESKQSKPKKGSHKKR